MYYSNQRVCKNMSWAMAICLYLTEYTVYHHKFCTYMYHHFYLVLFVVLIFYWFLYTCMCVLRVEIKFIYKPQIETVYKPIHTVMYSHTHIPVHAYKHVSMCSPSFFLYCGLGTSFAKRKDRIEWQLTDEEKRQNRLAAQNDKRTTDCRTQVMASHFNTGTH